MTRTDGRSTVRLAVLLTGLLVSACGDDVAAIAFSLRAAQSGSAHLLAAILLAQTVPAILLGLVGGVLVDRALRWWWWPCPSPCRRCCSW